MLSVDAALERVRESVPAPTPCVMAARDAVGQILAESIASEADSPPFDKSLMDGIAVRSQDLTREGCRVSIVGTIPAGQIADRTLRAGEAMWIMTGAPIPNGADAVVPRELLADGKEVSVHCQPRPGDHILRRGEQMHVGEVVLQAGERLTPARLALLLEMGRTKVSVSRSIRAAVLASGSELVDPDMEPGPGCIRNTNGPMLRSLFQQFHCHVDDLGIGADREDALREKIGRGLSADILVVSGGVSVGDFDLVPKVLVDLQVRNIFHGVAMRPGKPIWFGVAQGGCLVFGLPGNPLSVVVGFELFVRSAVRQLQGHARCALPWLRLSLDTEFRFRGGRETFWPARASGECPGAQVELLPWKGSADLRAFARATGLVRLTAGDYVLSAGSEVEYLSLEGGEGDDA